MSKGSIKFGRVRRALLAALLCGAIVGGASTQAAGSVRTTGPAPHTWYAFAPYAELTDYPPPNFTAIRHQADVRAVTLAFVTAQGGDRCVPSWGGYSAYPAFGSGAYELAELRSYRRAGGAVIPSFGGASGAELATVCGSVGALQSAYAKVISAYGVTHIDFDIEGADASNFAAAKRRATALAALQTAAAQHGRVLDVSLTLPVLPSGLTAEAERILRDTIDGGVSVSLVNGLAMDYGDSVAPDPSGRMAGYAIDVANSLRMQLHSIFPSLGGGALESLIGVTPMIGINDVSDEVFTTANAVRLATFARQRKLGMLSMWQLGRDKQCTSPASTAQTACSSVGQSPWMFAKLLGR
jgi:hypothetical protein